MSSLCLTWSLLWRQWHYYTPLPFVKLVLVVSYCSHRCPCLGKSRGRQKLDASGQEIRFLFHFSTFGPLFLFYTSRNDGCLIHLLCAKKLSLFLVPVCSETKSIARSRRLSYQPNKPAPCGYTRFSLLTALHLNMHVMEMGSSVQVVLEAKSYLINPHVCNAETGL